MYKGKTIAVVVPAYNEENLIIRVIDSMPDFIDRIIVVNDASTDNTLMVLDNEKNATTSRNNTHQKNQGVGGAIIPVINELKSKNRCDRSYGGDAQMDPVDLPYH